MRDRFSVGRCCCQCEDCCNGSFVDSINLEWTPNDERCTQCDENIGGNYVLQQGFGGAANCRWNYSTAFSELQYCNPGGPTLYIPSPYAFDTFISLYMSLTIKCYSATEYQILATVRLIRSYNEAIEYRRVNGVDVPVYAQGGYWVDNLIFSTNKLISEFDCADFGDVELSLTGGNYERIFSPLDGSAVFIAEFSPMVDYLDDGFGTEWKMDWICEPGTIKISSA